MRRFLIAISVAALILVPLFVGPGTLCAGSRLPSAAVDSWAVLTCVAAIVGVVVAGVLLQAALDVSLQELTGAPKAAASAVRRAAFRLADGSARKNSERFPTTDC